MFKKEVYLTNNNHTDPVIIAMGTYSDGQKFYVATENGVSKSLKDADAANLLYIHYIKKGWVKDHTEIIGEEPKAEKPEEKAVAAPKEPKPKKTRDEALTEKYGDIEVRRAYMSKKNEVIKAVKAEIVEWVKSHRRLTKDEYKDQLNKEVAKRMAEWKAETEACIG